ECAAANDALRVIAGGDSPLPDRRKAIHGGCGRGVPAAHAPARGDMTQTRPKPATARPIWIDGAWRDTPIHRRETLPAGVTIDGPALLVEENGTTFVAPGWRATVGRERELVLERAAPRDGREEIDARADPIMLEVFNNLFMHIAEQMGLVLEHTAHSVNIKERLDFSCALFDRGGELIANAPHVP